MRGPEGHTAFFEYRVLGRLVAYIHYQIFGGEFAGSEIYDHLAGEYVFLEPAKYDPSQIETYQEKIKAYLEVRKSAPKEFNNDDGPFAA